MGLNEIIDLANTAQKTIDRVFNSALNNNNTISNRSLANAQNTTARLNDAIAQIRQMRDQANMSGNKSDQDHSERVLAPLLRKLVSTTEKIASINANKFSVINNANTTSSRTFRSDQYDSQNIDDKLGLSEFRSVVRNLSSNLNRRTNNFNSVTDTGAISYNRLQGYRGSAAAMQTQANKAWTMLDAFKNGDEHSAGFDSRYNAIKQASKEANVRAQSSNATSEDVRKARALDEQVKQMDKMASQMNQFSNMLDRITKQGGSLETFTNSVENVANGGNKDVKVGYNPDSFMGQMHRRKYSIYRGMLASGLATNAAMLGQGNSLRLQAFDNIKSIGYANGDSDNRVLNSLGNAGYRYGYSGADMAGFANAYTSSTGNTGSTQQVTKAAQEWARQSRITGGNAETTQALEQAAGNAVNLTANQMKSLGNGITNEITSSGMSGKGAEQQQGLAMMYQNATAYGATNSNLRNMAGLQGSLAKYGSAFQGTAGAQTITQLAQGLGNYNNPAMRQLMGQGNSRYTGQTGAANLMEDMQNMQKNPASMSRVLSAAERSFGGNRKQAAAFLSQNTGVPIDTIMKIMQANDKGDLSKKTLQKYLKNSKQANKNDSSYQKSGAATVQKYNTALANSAMKASQALDKLRAILAKGVQNSGPFAGLMEGVGSGLGNFAGDMIAGGLSKNGIKAAWNWLKKGKTGKVLGKASDWLMSGRTGKVIKGASNWLKKGRTGKVLQAGKDILSSDHKIGKVFEIGKNAVGSASKDGGIVSKGLNAVKTTGESGAVRGLSKKLPGIGLVMGGLDLYNDFKSTKKGSVSRYKKVGGTVGSTAGMTIGGTVGATIGSAIPGVGTAIGGVAGSVVGGWLGGKVGKTVGGWAHQLFHPITAHAATRKNSKKHKGGQSDDWKLLRGYNKMLDHALRVVQEAKSIKAGGDSDSKDKGDISGLSGKGDKAIRSIAKAVAKKNNLDAKMVYAQLALESADGTSPEAVKDNNFAGIKGSGGGVATDDGGTYQHFNSIDDFANRYAEVLSDYPLKRGMSAIEYANALKHGKNGEYYTADPGSYASQLQTWADKYAIGGLAPRMFASGTGMIASQPTTSGAGDIFAEAGTEAYVPLNNSHYSSGLSALGDLAGLFGKKVVDAGQLANQRNTTINPSYNINLTIQGGTDNANSLAQTVAERVQAMLREFDQQQALNNKQAYYQNETSGIYI